MQIVVISRVVTDSSGNVSRLPIPFFIDDDAPELKELKTSYDVVELMSNGTYQYVGKSSLLFRDSSGNMHQMYKGDRITISAVNLS